MAGRRLAVALPSTPRVLPEPIPRPPSDLHASPSIASMLSGDFVSRPRYRCCCRLLHLKTASFLIAIVDTLFASAAFGRGVHLGLYVQHNPMAVAWFVMSSLMFGFGCLCTLAMFYGVWREKYLWMVPKLVMKVSAIVLYSSFTVALVYMMMEHSRYLLDLLAEHVTKSDYEAAQLVLKTGGGGLAVAFLLMALIHVWWFFVLYRCYKYLKDRYFWKQTRLIHSESNENHVAAIVASIPTASRVPGAAWSSTISTSSRSRLRNYSTSDDVNSAIIYSAGRNGSLQRSISTGGYDSRNNRTALMASNSANTLTNVFGSVRLQDFLSSTRSSSRIRPDDDSTPCSCHSPNLPHSSPERQMLFRGISQTNV